MNDTSIGFWRIRSILDAMTNAIVRFWDNRFHAHPLDEIVDYLKIESAKKDALNHKLINFFLESEKQEEEIDLKEYKPLNSHVPFSVRRAQLEKLDQDKKAEMKQDDAS